MHVGSLGTYVNPYLRIIVCEGRCNDMYLIIYVFKSEYFDYKEIGVYWKVFHNDILILAIIEHK